MNKTRFFKVILFLFLLINIEMNNISQVNALNVGEEANDFILETNKNQTIHFEDLKGKTVVLNFWTTWCTYCQEELAELQTFYEEKGDDVELIAVNLTASEQSEHGVLQFIDKSDIQFIVPMDIKGEVAKQYKIIGIPTTFIITKNGKVKKKILGPITAEMLHQYIDQF